MGEAIKPEDTQEPGGRLGSSWTLSIWIVRAMVAALAGMLAFYVSGQRPDNFCGTNVATDRSLMSAQIILEIFAGAALFLRTKGDLRRILGGVVLIALFALLIHAIGEFMFHYFYDAGMGCTRR